MCATQPNGEPGRGYQLDRMANGEESDGPDGAALRSGMRGEPRGVVIPVTDSSSQSGRRAVSRTWSSVSTVVLIAAAGTVVARMVAGPRYDGLLIVVAGAAAILLALQIPRGESTPSAPEPAQHDPLKRIFDSAGTMLIAISTDGSITHMNPAAERVLGYHAAELVGSQRTADILAAGEAPRLISELQRLSGIDIKRELSPKERLLSLMNSVRALPPSQVPSFEAQFRRKDGTVLPVTLHISALRNQDGAMEGLVVMAFDRTATLRQEQAARESQERYRDLFENSSEMIATLSTGGQFLYANPAWKRCFGLDNSSLLALDSFEELFGPVCRSDVTALFRRASERRNGGPLSAAQLHGDGRVLEFELSLSQRQKAGNPLAVRCLLRDVTQQRQREQRLALQLVVSQIVGENSSADVAAMRILEALCVSQGWDLALKWEVNTEENLLEFCAAWGAPDRDTEAMIQESMGVTLANGVGLPGKVWQEGRPIWMTDLAAAPVGPTDPDGAAALHGVGLGSAGAGRQQGAGGAGVLLPLPVARRPGSPGRDRDGGRLAGPDAGALAGARESRRIVPPAGNPAGLGGGRNLRGRPPRDGQLCQSGSGAAAGRSDGRPHGQAGP